MAPGPLDVQHDATWPLDSPYLAHVWARLRPLGNGAGRLPLDEPRDLRRQRPCLLFRLAALPRPWGPVPLRHATPVRDRGDALLRHPPPARRIGSLGHRAARRALGAVLPPHGLDVPQGLRRDRETSPVVARGIGRPIRPRARIEGKRYGAAGGAGPARHLPAPAARWALAGLDGWGGAQRLARKDSLHGSRYRGRRRRVLRPEHEHVHHAARAISVVRPARHGVLQSVVLPPEDRRPAGAVAALRASAPCEPARPPVLSSRSRRDGRHHGRYRSEAALARWARGR